MLIMSFAIDYEGEHRYITKKLLVPSYIDKYHLLINGKEVLPQKQIVDMSTYNQKKSVKLKTTLTPVDIYKENPIYDFITTENDIFTNSIKTFVLNLFTKELNPLYYYLAKFGLHKTINYFGMRDIIDITDEEYDKDIFYYFQINKELFLEVDKRFFDNSDFINNSRTKAKVELTFNILTGGVSSFPYVLSLYSDNGANESDEPKYIDYEVIPYSPASKFIDAYFYDKDRSTDVSLYVHAAGRTEDEVRSSLYWGNNMGYDCIPAKSFVTRLSAAGEYPGQAYYLLTMPLKSDFVRAGETFSVAFYIYNTNWAIRDWKLEYSLDMNNWYGYDEASLYFTLEVGPIEGDKRILLMEAIKEKGIRFNKKGLNPEAKYFLEKLLRIIILSLFKHSLINPFSFEEKSTYASSITIVPLKVSSISFNISIDSISPSYHLGKEMHNKSFSLLLLLFKLVKNSSKDEDGILINFLSTFSP